MDNFFLENNYVLWGEKEKYLNFQQVIFMVFGFSRCLQVQIGVWVGEENGCLVRLRNYRFSEEERKVKGKKEIFIYQCVLLKLVYLDYLMIYMFVYQLFFFICCFFNFGKIS